MSRVWQGERWEVREGSCFDYPFERVDVIISDPPFNAACTNGQRRGLGWRKGCEKREITFEHIEPIQVGPFLLARARRWVVLFCAIEQVGLYERAAPESWVRGGAWVKKNPTPQFSGDRPATWGEALAIMHAPGPKRWRGGGRSALWTHHSEHGANRRGRGERLHETQKPLALMRDLVELFSEPGELVWDPFGGSMTTGVACLQLDRRFVGHEIQPQYAELGAERLQAAENGQSLQHFRAKQAVMDLK
jgi:site-specific DNA-methyltransferase (adenine-specific)